MQWVTDGCIFRVCDQKESNAHGSPRAARVGIIGSHCGLSVRKSLHYAGPSTDFYLLASLIFSSWRCDSPLHCASAAIHASSLNRALAAESPISQRHLTCRSLVWLQSVNHNEPVDLIFRVVLCAATALVLWWWVWELHEVWEWKK
jgi:hypothetical protein